MILFIWLILSQHPERPRWNCRVELHGAGKWITSPFHPVYRYEEMQMTRRCGVEP